jgi:hypothetical protein
VFPVRTAIIGFLGTLVLTIVLMNRASKRSGAVASLVPDPIVELLEVIDVREQHRKRLSTRPCRGCRRA